MGKSEVRSNVWSRPGGLHVGNQGKLTLLGPLSILKRQGSLPISFSHLCIFFDLEMAGILILIKFYQN